MTQSGLVGLGRFIRWPEIEEYRWTQAGALSVTTSFSRSQPLIISIPQKVRGQVEGILSNQLPEGRRGIFVGGGGSVRIAKIIGVSRLTELMLTGRRVDAETGERLGLSHYLVEPGESLKTALEIAENVGGNAQISNYMMLYALAQISEMPDEPGLFTEAVSQALTLTSGDATAGIEAFLQKRDIRF